MGLGKIIKASTSQWRRLLFLEVFYNKQNKITKASDDSVISGIAGGVARVAGKAEKDIFLALSTLFPDMGFGETLDQVAKNFSIAPRFINQGSSVYVRINAEEGTLYQAGVHNFITDNGTQFALSDDVTMNDFGFTYIKLYSLNSGSETNVPAFSINQVIPQPNGHAYVINEFPAQGGFDLESDDTFTIRIKNGINILAKNTLASLEQAMMLVDNRVLKIYHQGIDLDGKTVIAIATQNGVDLLQSDFDTILNRCSEYLSLIDYRPNGRDFFGIKLKNIEYQPIDISFRVDLDGTRLADDVRRDIQVKIGRMLDYRFFDPNKQKVEWDDILHIVKSTVGVKYVLDQYFSPRVDVSIDYDKLPRLRGFLMLDLNGQVISSMDNKLTPIYYPQEADFEFQENILKQIV